MLRAKLDRVTPDAIKNELSAVLGDEFLVGLDLLVRACLFTRNQQLN
jgi:hypothetical protein